VKSSLRRRCFKVHILVVDVRDVLSVVGSFPLNLRHQSGLGKAGLGGPRSVGLLITIFKFFLLHSMSIEHSHIQNEDRRTNFCHIWRVSYSHTLKGTY
jgi:hypothetical protein